MATIPGLTQPQQQQKGDEHNPSDPMIGTAQEPQNNGGISEDDQQRLISLVRRYKDQWSQERIKIISRVSSNFELFKGNSNFVMGPGMATIDVGGWMDSMRSASGHAEDSDDTDLAPENQNFYQLFNVVWVASLSAQLPKSKWRPEDADEILDVTMAKAAQTLIDIVQRKNGAKSLFKSQLFQMFNGGVAFKHTRWLVNADRYGTKQEPVFDVTDTEIMPGRMHCYACGADSPPDSMGGNALGGLACPQCGSPMGPDSFYPPVTGPMTRKVGVQDVPQGMAAQNIYGALEVDADPCANTLRQTPVLNLEYEVHLAAVRAAYPGMYSQIQASATSELSNNASVDRLARQQLYAQSQGYQATLTDQRPTLSKSWIQSWAFDLEDDQAFGERMREIFPNGCLLINVGPTFLSAMASDLNKEWTVARTHEDLGMYPPSPGDVIRPFQINYDNLAAIMQDGIERLCMGLIAVNNDLIDSRSLNGKRMLPGVLNPIKLKRSGAPGAQKLSDVLHQFEFVLNIAELMEYQKFQMFSAQTFASIQPQTYGGAGDPNIQTLGGQQQQLQTANNAKMPYWDNVKEEHAQADELAVECASNNMTQDMKMAIEEKGAEFRNQTVRLDDLQGSAHAYSDIDQGIPITADELRQQMMSLVQEAVNNPLLQGLFQDPANQELAGNAIGIPGLKMPDSEQYVKTLADIDQLLKATPYPAIDPQTGAPAVDPATGQPKMMPTIMPNPDIDDITVVKQVIRGYFQKNYDVPQKNPAGFSNVLAYIRECTTAQTQQAAQDESSKGKAALAGHLASLPPPPPPKQLPPAEQSLQNALRQAGMAALANQIRIGSSGPLAQGESNQAAEAANADILQLVANMEKLANEATSPQGQ